MLSVEKLHDLFLEAAETDRRMPPAVRKAKMASWVEYPMDWHGYGWTQQGVTHLKPTSQQIDNFDKALALTFKMPEIDRKIVWAVAHSAAFRDRGAKWTQIARLLSLNDTRIVKRRYQDALIELFYKQ